MSVHVPIEARPDGLRRLMPVDAPVARALLRSHTPFNAYLLALIARGAVGHDEVAGPMVGYWKGGELEGICVLGSNLVISHPASSEAVETFADYARRSGAAFWVAVGEDGTMDRFMKLYGRQARPIRIERAEQTLFRLVEVPDVEDPGAGGELRLAEPEDLGVVLRTDLAMVLEELGFDPFESVARAYRDGWLRRIREGRAWVVGSSGGPIAFKVDQSATSNDLIQLAGIYTVPDQRRLGIAESALSVLCARLLDTVPMVTLYVDQNNEAAIHLYEKLGFEPVGAIRSIWFEI